jgi:hypothetical protein
MAHSKAPTRPSKGVDERCARPGRTRQDHKKRVLTVSDLREPSWPPGRQDLNLRPLDPQVRVHRPLTCEHRNVGPSSAYLTVNQVRSRLSSDGARSTPSHTAHHVLAIRWRSAAFTNVVSPVMRGVAGGPSMNAPTAVAPAGLRRRSTPAFLSKASRSTSALQQPHGVSLASYITALLKKCSPGTRGVLAPRASRCRSAACSPRTRGRSAGTHRCEGERRPRGGDQVVLPPVPDRGPVGEHHVAGAGEVAVGVLPVAGGHRRAGRSLRLRDAVAPEAVREPAPGARAQGVKKWCDAWRRPAVSDADYTPLWTKEAQWNTSRCSRAARIASCKANAAPSASPRRLT